MSPTTLNQIHEVYQQDGSGPFPVQVWQVTLVADAAGEASATSSGMMSYLYRGLAGYVDRVELDPGTLKAAATLKGYDARSTLADPRLFMDYVVPASVGEDHDVAVAPILIGGDATVELAGANENDTVTLNVYVNPYGRSAEVPSAVGTDNDQRLTVSTTAVQFAAFPAACTIVLMSVQDAAVMWTKDKTDPTASNGLKLEAGQYLRMTKQDAERARFIRADSADAAIHATPETV